MKVSDGNLNDIPRADTVSEPVEEADTDYCV